MKPQRGSVDYCAFPTRHAVFINPVNDSKRHTKMLTACSLLVLLLGCTTAEQKKQQTESMSALRTQLEALEANVATAQATLEDLRVEQQNAQHNLLQEIEKVANIQETAAAVCRSSSRSVTSQCGTIQTVIMSGDKFSSIFRKQ